MGKSGNASPEGEGKQILGEQQHPAKGSGEQCFQSHGGQAGLGQEPCAWQGQAWAINSGQPSVRGGGRAWVSGLA